MNEQATRFVAEVRKGRSTEAAGTAVGATPEQVSGWLGNDVVQKAIAAPKDEPKAEETPVKAKASKPKRAPRKRVTRKK